MGEAVALLCTVCFGCESQAAEGEHGMVLLGYGLGSIAEWKTFGVSARLVLRDGYICEG